MADDFQEKFLHLQLPKLWPGLASIFACLAVLGLGMAPAIAASFTASLDRDTLTLGDTATLKLNFEGGSPNNLSVPAVPGLKIIRSQNFSINFSSGSGVAANSQIAVEYSVTPEREGEFTIPAMTADVNGQQLTSQPLKLTVMKANAPSSAAINSGNEVAFMRLLLPQKSICRPDDHRAIGNLPP